ncbi:MAG: SH3 domain-containing protein [Limisphaerales bacterium]
MKAKYLLLVALAGFPAHPAAAFDEGIVKGKNVNVRGQAYINSEVVTQLQEGERVVIIEKVKASRPSGKFTDWYKIALPSNTPVWVHGKYVVDGKVTASRLNIRSGPGEKFSVLGRVQQGAAVTEIRRVDPWVEIESPESTHGYVVTSLLNVASLEPTPAPVAGTSSAPVPPPTPVTNEPVPFTPSTAESVVTTEITPVTASPITPVNAAAPPSAVPMATATSTTVAEIVPADPSFQTVQTETVVTSSTGPVVAPNALLTAPEVDAATAETEVSFRVVDPNKKKGTLVGNWFKNVFSRKNKKEPEAQGSVGPAAVPEGGQFHPAPSAESGPPAVRFVTREGKVVRAWNIQAPSDWALQEIYTGRVINYLWTTHTNIPWKELSGRIIRVTGEEAIERRWQRTPVLHIQTLKTIDGDGDE